MRQRLIIIVSLVAVVAVLVLLNAASYVKVEPTPDSESSPHRSSYNTGATGTHALYDFLHEAGYQVVRWREPTSSLLSSAGPKPATVVVIGHTRIPFSRVESKEILLWVEAGGRLVIIDRTPDPKLLPKSGEWTIKALLTNFPWPDLDPTDFEQMTRDVKPLSPSQPTLLVRKVESVMPSRFASAISFARLPSVKNTDKSNAHDEPPGGGSNDDEDSEPEPEATPDISTQSVSPAPVSCIAADRGSLLIERSEESRVGKGCMNCYVSFMF